MTLLNEYELKFRGWIDSCNFFKVNFFFFLGKFCDFYLIRNDFFHSSAVSTVSFILIFLVLVFYWIFFVFLK